jgi:hypothetical protein
MYRKASSKLSSRFVVVIAMVWLVYTFYQEERSLVSDSDTTLAQAYENGESDIQIKGEGVIIKVLPDDDHGSRHQRLLIRLASGQTVLIAHNIDLAPRIPDPQLGDTLEFFGEYEWNQQGGVIHWTHHDPKNRHTHGFLRHNGNLYQ